MLCGVSQDQKASTQRQAGNGIGMGSGAQDQTRKSKRQAGTYIGASVRRTAVPYTGSMTDSNSQNSTETLEQQLALLKALADKPLVLPPVFVDITGSHTAGLLLQQCIYWTKKNLEKDPASVLHPLPNTPHQESRKQSERAGWLHAIHQRQRRA